MQDGGFHLVLLAENNAGWKNLLYLASEAYLTGFYYKPRIDKELLSAHADGLIAINGHLGSELAHHLVEYEKTKDPAHWKNAIACAQWHAQTFQPGPKGPRFYVELQRHVPEQEAINPHLKRLARTRPSPRVRQRLTLSKGRARAPRASRWGNQVRRVPAGTEDLFVSRPSRCKALFSGARRP